MNYPRVATRYSKALLELSIEQNVLDVVRADAALTKESVLASGELALLLKNPVVKSHKKQGAGYGDCPQDNDPWCGEMLFPVTLLNVPDHTGEIVVSNDSILQYYRWFVCQ